MTIEETRRRLRYQKLLRDFPRRKNATFTDENNHNPLVLEECPRCGGRGFACNEASGHAALDTCDLCNGKEITGRVVPYFDLEDDPKSPAAVDDLGWVTCPGCGIRFAIEDTQRWTGQRHRTCGRWIVVE